MSYTFLNEFRNARYAGSFDFSTVSSGLNSLAAITLEDFVRYFYPNMSDKTATIVSKSLSVVYGLICFGLVFVAEQLGGVLQAALSIFGMVGGPLLGVFTLGMFFPWANSKGAFTGTITSLAFMFWLGIGANLAITRKQIITPKLDISVDGCLHGNFTLPPTPEGERLLVKFTSDLSDKLTFTTVAVEESWNFTESLTCGTPVSDAI